MRQPEDTPLMVNDIVRKDGGGPSQPGQAPSRPWAVVLAGGNGTRLQGFVRQVLGSDRPKQFCRIVGTRSMLRHTWDRAVRVVPPDRVLTVVTAGQEHHLEVETRIGAPSTVVVQPENRGTAAGLLLPLLWIGRHNPVATVAVFPADHFIWEEDRFEGHVRAALALVHRHPGRLILIGVKAEGPETKYGWIAPGESLEAGSSASLYGVERFWEKPDRRTASRLFAEGCLWNTLIMAGRLDAYLRLAEAAAPEVFASLHGIAACLDTPAEPAAVAATYRRLPTSDLSRDILARHPEGLAVLAAADIGWSDWGDPGRILRTLRRFDLRPRWLAERRRGAPPGEPGGEASGSSDR